MSEEYVTFYTRFPSKQVFDLVFSFLNPGINDENFVHVRNQSADKQWLVIRNPKNTLKRFSWYLSSWKYFFYMTIIYWYNFGLWKFWAILNLPFGKHDSIMADVALIFSTSLIKSILSKIFLHLLKCTAFICWRCCNNLTYLIWKNSCRKVNK